MEHKALTDLQRVAEVRPVGTQRMTRRQRLERWAKLLDEADQPMRALLRVEFLPPHERAVLGGAGTPLALAYADPILREQGLAGDRLMDAMQFFELSYRDVHYLLCDCHFHGTMTSRSVAARVRSLLPRVTLGDMCTKAWSWLSGKPATA